MLDKLKAEAAVDNSESKDFLPKRQPDKDADSPEKSFDKKLNQDIFGPGPERKSAMKLKTKKKAEVKIASHDSSSVAQVTINRFDVTK